MKTITYIAVLLLSGCGRPPAARVVAYGDSHTEGLSGLNGAPGYVVRLAGEMGLPLNNRAVGGSRISMAGQLPSVLQDEQEPEASEGVIVYLTGYNDERWGRDPEWTAYRRDLRQALVSLGGRGVSAKRILVGNCMRMRSDQYVGDGGPKYGGFINGSDEAVASINIVIAEEVERAGYTLVDAYSAIDPDLHSSFDLIHLSEEGHAILAELFRKALDTK